MIEVVSRPGCVYCDKAKEWLTKNGIPFRAVDGGTTRGGVPQLRIDGRVEMIGWNADEWSRKIRASKASGMAMEDEMMEEDEIDMYDEESEESSGSLKEFFTTPAPPSETHRAVVTTVGALGGAIAARRSPSFTPRNEALIGAATILAGHFLLKRWEVKSIGYGLLGDAAFRAVTNRLSPEKTPAPVSAPAPAPAPAPQVSSTSPGVVSESQFLEVVESRAAAEADAEVASPSGSSALMVTHVRMSDGRILPLQVYQQTHGDRISAAVSRGRQRAEQRRRDRLAQAQAQTTRVPPRPPELNPPTPPATVPPPDEARVPEVLPARPPVQVTQASTVSPGGYVAHLSRRPR
jgi:glutaredoxin